MGVRANELTINCLADHRAGVQRTIGEEARSRLDYAREIEDEVNRLTGIMEDQRAARIEAGERAAGVLDAELQKVEDAVVTEQKLRFEAESTVQRMVEDLSARMVAEIQRERSQREAVQGKLLSLLEDACGRIEATFEFT